jgi:hypothetical protein
MNYGRVSRKGSGVVFGRRVFPVDGRSPKTTPDPIRVAYLLNKSDSCFFADPKTIRFDPDAVEKHLASLKQEQGSES